MLRAEYTYTEMQTPAAGAMRRFFRDFFVRVSRKKSSYAGSVVDPVVKSAGRETSRGRGVKCGRCFALVTRRRARFNHLRFNNHRREETVPPRRRSAEAGHRHLPRALQFRYTDGNVLAARSWESRSVPANKLHRPKRISHLHRPD